MKLQEIQIKPLFSRCELTLVLPKEEYHSILELFKGVGPIDPAADYTVTIKKTRKRRSKDANAYYWTVCSALAEVTGVSRAEMHNILLSRYGQDWTTEDGRLRLIMLPDNDSYLFEEKFHLRATDKTRYIGGEIYREYVLVKPSHLYDSKEMARLIDGLVQEAHAVGIQTLTPKELAELEYLGGTA
jgi:hypothetical protein